MARSSQGWKVQIRDVAEDDLAVLFEHQLDPDANQMAAFPARDRDAFMAHWGKILADESVLAKTILSDGCIAVNVVSWLQDGKRLVGYWIGKSFWRQGVATAALREFVQTVPERPIYAYVAKHNIASIRVFEKSGFVMSSQETRNRGGPADGIGELVYRLDHIEGASPE